MIYRFACDLDFNGRIFDKVKSVVSFCITVWHKLHIFGVLIVFGTLIILISERTGLIIDRVLPNSPIFKGLGITNFIDDKMLTSFITF